VKTIKQIADMLQVDKQRVYRYIRNNHINEAHHEAGMMWFDEAAIYLITQHFSRNNHINEAHQTTSLDAVIFVLQATIDTLQGQLKVKDEQLKAAQEALKAEQLLHADTKKMLSLPGQTDTQSQPTRHRGIFARILSKK